MLTYEDGIEQVRKIITNDPKLAHPKYLNNDLLELVIYCSENKESKLITLPIMLVLHLFKDDQDEKEYTLNIIRLRFDNYREECIKEFRKRNINLIPFREITGDHQYD